MDEEQRLCLSRGHPYQILIDLLHKVETADPTLYNRFCSWQDVVGAIEEAKAEDSAKANRTFLRMHLRAAMRNSAPAIATLDSLATMIPDQDGLSVLRGALTTVFKLVHLRLENRAMILEVFHDIPDRLVKAAEAESRFPDARDLRNAVTQLCDTLVEKLGILIPILLRSHPEKNKLARLWKQHPGKEHEVIQSCLAEISRASIRVEQCSTAALERTVGEINTRQRTMADSTDRLHDDLKMVKTGVVELHAEVISSKTLVKHALETIHQMVKGSQEQQYLCYGSPQLTPLPWSTVPAIATPRLLTAAPFTQTEQMLYRPISPLTPPSSQRSFDDLLIALDVPEHAAADALTCVTQRGKEPRLNAATKGEHLLMMDRFQGWLAAPHSSSDLILVDGHCGNVSVDKVSPMSAITAALVEVLQDRPTTIVLHHFCGQCLGPGSLSGPSGLIRSLIHQLLRQNGLHTFEIYARQPALDFLDDELTRCLEDHDIPTLCRVFCHLVVQLEPSRPVFCIIDGVSELETVLDGWQDDTCCIVKTLLDLVDDTSRAGPALKVLLTSSERSTKLVDSVILPDRRISMPAARVLGSQSCLSLFREHVDDLLMIDDAEGSSSETGDVSDTEHLTPH